MWTPTTHTTCAPTGRMILSKAMDIGKKINKSGFTGCRRDLMHVIAARRCRPPPPPHPPPPHPTPLQRAMQDRVQKSTAKRVVAKREAMADPADRKGPRVSRRTEST